MAFLCQRPDGNLLFPHPHPHPSPATTVFVFGTAARAGEGGRWPGAVTYADEPRAASRANRQPTDPSPPGGGSQANVWRQPRGGSVVSASAGRTRRGSPITAKQKHGNTRQNAAFASPLRPARVRQPADAGRSPTQPGIAPCGERPATETTTTRYPPTPGPSPATMSCVFGGASRAGEGGRGGV